MDLEELKSIIENDLTPKRFIHSLNVMNTAVKLADRYGVDRQKAAIAGLLHDYARDVRCWDMVPLCEKYQVPIDDISHNQPELLHGPLASVIVREKFGIVDLDVLEAIYFHTTGRQDMSILEKIIFISDYIEPGRVFPGVDDIRKLAYADIDSAVILALDSTIKYVIKKGALLHPDSIDARNFIIERKRALRNNGQPCCAQSNKSNQNIQNNQSNQNIQSN